MQLTVQECVGNNVGNDMWSGVCGWSLRVRLCVKSYNVRLLKSSTQTR